MSRTKTKTVKTGSDRLFSIATILLAVVFVILALVFVNKVRENRYHYISEPNEILRELKRGEYPDALDSVESNRASGVFESDDEGYIAPYALVDYLKAESYWIAYTRVGDAAAAAPYKEEMDRTLGNAGDLAFMAASIDAIFAED